jgi:hypothetical protein
MDDSEPQLQFCVDAFLEELRTVPWADVPRVDVEAGIGQVGHIQHGVAEPDTEAAQVVLFLRVHATKCFAEALGRAICSDPW